MTPVPAACFCSSPFVATATRSRLSRHGTEPPSTGTRTRHGGAAEDAKRAVKPLVGTQAQCGPPLSRDQQISEADRVLFDESDFAEPIMASAALPTVYDTPSIWYCNNSASVIDATDWFLGFLPIMCVWYSERLVNARILLKHRDVNSSLVSVCPEK